MGIGQDKINQALQMSNNYSKDINGVRKLINENGGTGFLNKALEYYNNPLVKMALNKIGVTQELVESVKRDLGVGSTPSQSTNTNDILTKLKHLK